MSITRDAQAPITAPTTSPSQVPTLSSRRRLLSAGLAAGPLFLGVGLTHAFLRDGFDLERHALSQLALGSWGFVQIATFLLTGALVIAAARGLRPALGAGPGAVWGPRLLAGFGVGMLIAGVFIADPANAFPVGTPEGPGQVSWHGALHGLGFMIAMTSWAAACVVLARASAARGDRTQAGACVLALVAVLAVAVVPWIGSFGVRAVILSAVQLGLVGLLCVRAIRATATVA